MSYADVNGLSLYYAEHGSGEPLVLLHGGFGTGEMFGPVLPALAAQRRVIAVDLQAHGRTADAGRPLRYETMADDVAALIGHLGLVRSDVMGVSMGGGSRCARRSSTRRRWTAWCWSRRRSGGTAGPRDRGGDAAVHPRAW